MRRWMLIVALAACALDAHAIDEAHEKKADQMIAKAVAYLRAQQQDDGAWTLNPQGPALPAVTGLIVDGMLAGTDVSPTDPDVADAVAYLISMQKPDGGIYGEILPNYNTAIAVSALSRADTPEADDAIKKAVAFLRTLQWGDSAGTDAVAAGEAQRVEKEHPFYGGVGYGNHSRPDSSNLNFFVQALHNAGVEDNDPALVRAVAFLQRTQMHDEVNDLAYADGSRQGGFIYSTGPAGDKAGEGESKAGMIEETMDDGSHVSRLRAYGSVTYAGFKSYVYARLDRDDPRVRYAWEWIKKNYTLDENPGLGDPGLYYYFVTFSRALDAWGEETIQVEAGEEPRDWANDLIDRLATLQNEDGSFKSVHERWMEGSPVMTTAYALIALQAARN